LVAANHPGGPDSVLIGAALPRDDLKIIVNGGEFLRGLPHAGEHFIHTTTETPARMAALRAAIRHLQAGGALLVFASTRVDPDPDVAPGADTALDTWSPSLELMLDKVPQARLQIAISSGVILRRWVHSPLVRLFQSDPWERQRLAEYLQVSQLLLTSSSLELRPRTTFGRAITARELRDLNPAVGLLENAIELARQVLTTHMTTAPECAAVAVQATGF